MRLRNSIHVLSTVAHTLRGTMNVTVPCVYLGGAHSCWFMSMRDPEKVLFLHRTLTISTPEGAERERRGGGAERGTALSGTHIQITIHVYIYTHAGLKGRHLQKAQSPYRD